MSESAVERHYTRSGLIEAIREALALSGKSIDRLAPADLAPIDEFHIRGRAATLELGERLTLDRDSLVLDVGAGLGGTARHLAAAYGCRVIGIDVTAEYCRAAAALAQWVGLSGRVCYRHANALDLPFADYQFDAVTTLHAAMNIADKGTLYGEAFRVLKPGGQLALYDVLQGEAGAIHLPVPWARATALSHLVTAAELETLLHDAGFEIESWRDGSATARDWFAATGRRLAETGPPPLSLALLLGEDFPAMSANMRRNLEEGRIEVVEAVCRRPG